MLYLHTFPSPKQNNTMLQPYIPIDFNNNENSNDNENNGLPH